MKEIILKLIEIFDNKIVTKLMSGRYLLTVIGGIVFAYAVWKRVLEPQATSAILTAIIMSYFSRNDRIQNGGQK